MRIDLRIVSLLLSLLALVLAVIMVPRPAWAIEYEIFIDVDTEEELNELWNTGQISEDTYTTLIELRRRGVDLNQADRDELYSLPNLSYEDVDAILAYRAEAGTIHAPADLVAAGVLSREKLGSILTYVRAYDDKRKLGATSGWIRYQTAWSQMDRTVPPMALQARVTTLRQLTIGVAGVLARQLPGEPIWDPNREALTAAPTQPRPYLPKYFVQWDTSKWGIIAGTYRIGFGQKLVFDNSGRYTPNGFFLDDTLYSHPNLGKRCRESAGELPISPCAGDEYYTYGTRDFRWSDGLRGVAVGAKHIAAPVGWMQLYGFGSYQPRQLYQYDVYDRRSCDDPLRITDEVCKAPPVYVLDRDNPLAPTSSHYAQTLQHAYDEVLGGANVSWFFDRRTHVGVTGYGATALWKVEGADLDFRRASMMPWGGPWGAVGADMAWGRRWSDLAFEVARSFDSMSSPSDPNYGGGGWAGIMRHTSTFANGHELEISARYYDKKYANPHASPIAQADEYHGNRARDEAGGRVRYGGRVADRLDLRGMANLWVQPSERALKLESYLRADVDVNSWFRPGLWVLYRNIDLGKTGRIDTDVINSEILEEEVTSADQAEACILDSTGQERYDCPIETGQLTGRLAFRPLKDKLTITAQYQHEFIDDARLDGMRQDVNAFIIVRANPVRSFRIVTRLRYLSMDIRSNKTYEESIWAYLELSYVFAKLFLVRTRYDGFAWLDQRDRTLLRIPRIEHRLRLELEVRF